MKISQFLQTLKIEPKYGTSQNAMTKDQVSETIMERHTSKSSEVNQLFTKYNVSPTKEEVKSIDTFMSKAEGNTESKLNTVEVALFKGIEPTTSNLQSIHEALNNDPELALEVLLPGVDTAKTTPAQGAIDNQSPADKASDATKDYEQIIENLKVPESVKKALITALKEGKSIEEAVKTVAEKVMVSLSNKESKISGEPMEKITKALEALVNQTLNTNNGGKQMHLLVDLSVLITAVQNAIEQAVEQVAKQTPVAVNIKQMTLEVFYNLLKEGLANSSSSIENAKVTDDPIILNFKEEESSQQNDQDKTLKADEKGLSINQRVALLVREITAREQNPERAMLEENSDEKIVSSQQPVIEDQPVSDEDLIQMIETTMNKVLAGVEGTYADLAAQFDVKTYIVETITQKSIELKEQFTQAKNEILNAIRPEQSSKVDMESQIQKAITTLEKTILRSEIALYTSMTTEKKLMVASGQLQDALELLASGQTKKALELVKSVHEDISKLTVNTNQKKIQTFALQKTQETLQMLKPGSKEDLETVKSFKMQARVQQALDFTKDDLGNRTGRDVLEVLRSVGLNHEMEVAEAVAQKTNPAKNDVINENIKEILLKLMKEEISERVVESGEKTLMNLSGQQMMNDSDSNNPQKFQFFNMPFEDDQEINHMKVYMTGKNNQEVLDYKNAELYFGMNLHKLGDTGIRIQIKNEKVTLSVLNDHVETFKQAFSDVKEQLEDIGYELEVEQYESYKKEVPYQLNAPTIVTDQKNKPTSPELKGFDFKI